MRVWVVVALVAITEFALHYFPWRKLLKGKDLPRPAAYALGVSGLMVPFSAWLFERGEYEIVQTLWIVIVAGGLTVMALYGLDRHIDLEWNNIESSEREALRRKQDGKEG